MSPISTLSDQDFSQTIADKVAEAYASSQALNISGAGSKAFLGEAPKDAEPLEMAAHRGIIEYDPSELVLVVRAGTPLAEIEALLAEKNQMLGFEPPLADKGATIGGSVAAGLSGPRRPYSGAVRDFLLGAEFVNGKGEIIKAGGKVIKNVAGFDLFRPMAGAMGTLGVLLNVSLRLLPKPVEEATLVIAERDQRKALRAMNNYPMHTPAITAACFDGAAIRLRLSGAKASIDHAQALLGGVLDNNTAYWQKLKNWQSGFFTDRQGEALWRISVPPMAEPLDLDGEELIDWGGAQRFFYASSFDENEASRIRARAEALGGQAECYTPGAASSFHPLPAEMLAVHQRVKAALDPKSILNPGRLYPGL